MYKTAIVLVGAVTSGKTTMATHLSEALGFEVINEEKTGNYFKIIKEIDGNIHPRAIYDHCYIYTQLALLSKEYDKVLLCFLKLSENLLKENYQNRNNEDKYKKGDYLKINPVQQQKNLEYEILEWKNLIDLLPNVELLECSIVSTPDYDKIKQKIIDSIEK